jgi:hypothetical protein
MEKSSRKLETTSHIALGPINLLSLADGGRLHQLKEYDTLEAFLQSQDTREE